MAKLPTDGVLRKLFQLGQTDSEIAEEYDVTVAAVNKRMVAMGLRRKPIATRVTEGINRAWDLKSEAGTTSHHNKRPIQGLKYYLRQQLGDQLSATQTKHMNQLLKRLERDNVILDYDRDSVDGYVFRERQPEDGRRVMRWPDSAELPSEEFRAALELPQPEQGQGDGGSES
ncbi:hypothetical protein RCO28_12610 [Streptomyces sp. LHD-70]|uniref:hypothetical protein n=1 Tax=Streptomyces sp. LHD-70 TaxID=3072140 RepID=UPI00280FD208|nr:hypothetical protein [Streptomyces sp. LHD-70]MDQ8703323.1 hypothetical protein [Streptomyces sp. LHD-70]